VVEQFGSPEDVYLRPATRFVASFLGSVNWIDGVGLRPESTAISRTEVAGGRRGTVTRSVFLGNLIQVFVKLEGGEEVHGEVARTAEAFRAGEGVWVCWRREDEIRLK
jgi:ABC-type Fe3+/spermidine/putrescine transport system ATPase subunit